MKYVISAGTNIGNREENLRKAIEQINNLPYTEVIKASAVYETSPIGYARQQDFYNAIFVVESNFEPHEMLGICLGIETATGRVRTIPNGPRILDLDLIFAEDEKINTLNLIIPHPRYHERHFVLQPLKDVFEDGEAFGIKFGKYLIDVQDQEIKKTYINLI